MGDRVLQYAITIENGDLKKRFANYFQTENEHVCEIKKKKNKLQRHEVASCPGFSSVTNPGKRRAIHNLSVARRGAITIENGDLKN